MASTGDSQPSTLTNTTTNEASTSNEPGPSSRPDASNKSRAPRQRHRNKPAAAPQSNASEPSTSAAAFPFNPNAAPYQGGFAPPPTSAVPHPSTSLQQPHLDSNPKPARRRKPRQKPPRTDEAQQNGEQPAPNAAPPGLAPSSNNQRRQQGGARRSNAPTAAVDQQQQEPRPQDGGQKQRQRNRKKPSKDGGNQQQAANARNTLPPSGEQRDDLPHCLVCYSPMEYVSIGECNHKDVCHACCLRLRVGYDKMECPLCKTTLKKVVIAPWRPDLPDFSAYMARQDVLPCCKDGRLGKGTVYADPYRPFGGRYAPDELLKTLLGTVSLSCKACDRHGLHPFARPGQLENHLSTEHRLSICGVCLREGHAFPMELDLYKSRGALAKHIRDTHPECKFCKGRPFYDSDALWHHMHQAHFKCYVCGPEDNAYFNTATDLSRHLNEEHFPCDHPECSSGLIAFATEDALRAHMQDFHSGRMPRWDPSRSRPLPLDLNYSRGGGTNSNNLNNAARGSSRSITTSGANTTGSRRVGYDLETEGGYVVVDDDYGMQNEHNFPRMPPPDGNFYGGSRGRDRYSTALQGSSRFAGARSTTPQEDFPSLASTDSQNNQQQQQRPNAPPPLIKHRLRCPCGRRTTNFVAAEGDHVPTLECDAVCGLEGRRAQLANAFGVDPNHHINAFERRNAVYSADLISVAKKDPELTKQVEQHLAEFVADVKVLRRLLPPMPKSARWFIHNLAAQYGIATVAQGQEPRRAIELLKATQQPGLPSKLLSSVARTVTEEELAQMLASAQGHMIRFVDIAPSVDVRYYLKRWEGRFTLEWQNSERVVVRFEEEKDRDEALDTFGGGVRGLFRVDREYHPKTGVDTSASGASSSSKAPWTLGGAGTSEGASDSSWTQHVVAPVHGSTDNTIQHGREQEPRQRGQDGANGINTSRFAVIGSVRRPRVPQPIEMSNRMAVLEIEDDVDDDDSEEENNASQISSGGSGSSSGDTNSEKNGDDDDDDDLKEEDNIIVTNEEENEGNADEVVAGEGTPNEEEEEVVGDVKSPVNAGMIENNVDVTSGPQEM